MSNLIGRTILTAVLLGRALILTLRALAYLLGGFLFGILPLLVVLLVKSARWSWKATVWLLGAILAAAVLIVRTF